MEVEEEEEVLGKAWSEGRKVFVKKTCGVGET